MLAGRWPLNQVVTNILLWSFSRWVLKQLLNRTWDALLNPNFGKVLNKLNVLLRRRKQTASPGEWNRERVRAQTFFTQSHLLEVTMWITIWTPPFLSIILDFDNLISRWNERVQGFHLPVPANIPDFDAGHQARGECWWQWGTWRLGSLWWKTIQSASVRCRWFSWKFRVAKCQIFYTEQIFQTKFYPKKNV